MRFRGASILCLLWLSPILLSTPLAQGETAQPPIPQQPKYYVLDEAQALTAQQNQALSTLLIEHDQTTGEQIVIAILKSTEGEDPIAKTTLIFNQWEVSSRAGGNGALLTLFLKESKAAIQVGYGMSTRLTDSKVKTVINDFLMPEISAGQSFRALGLSSLEILRALESPLIESGRAQEILRAGGIEGRFQVAAKGLSSWFIWVLAGIGLFLVVLTQLNAAEAHFTSGGWFRPRPWKQALQGLRRRLSSTREERIGRSSLGGSDASW